MQRALGAKNKLRFVDGSVEIPALHDFNRHYWERCNHLVHSWILNSVSDQIGSTIVFHENAIDVWRDLQERFSKVDRIRIATLRSSINNLKQGTKTVLDYFTEMKALWEELTLIVLFQLVIQFLTGLNDTFSVVKTQVLLMDPLPSLNKVYSLVIQEESNHLPVAVTDDASSLINATQRNPFRGKGPSTSGKKYCTFCHRTNHDVEFCYAKHGFPNVQRGNASVNASTHDTGSSSNGDLLAGNSANSNATSISQDKYDQLVALLQQVNLLPQTPNPANDPAPSTNHISASMTHNSSLDSTTGPDIQEDDWFG
ncbi:hypothetical protein TSUD_380690 [Trifolium subterraneum]|uniref:Uncharacterized protein n=1 Tax=Trifolium subterraneum TaxID=3900 RepID=A0A2Z6MUG2_TRISU|nr:hypothetical protein TSUD_380690 [Trifolium subterraneum]